MAPGPAEQRGGDGWKDFTFLEGMYVENDGGMMYLAIDGGTMYIGSK